MLSVLNLWVLLQHVEVTTLPQVLISDNLTFLNINCNPVVPPISTGMVTMVARVSVSTTRWSVCRWLYGGCAL